MSEDLQLLTPSVRWPKPVTKGPKAATSAAEVVVELHRIGDDQLRCQHLEHYRACRDCHPVGVLRQHFDGVHRG